LYSNKKFFNVAAGIDLPGLFQIIDCKAGVNRNVETVFIAP